MVACYGIGRQGNNWDARRVCLPLPLTNMGCCGEPIHNGHLAVHEDEVIGAGGGELKGLTAVFGAVRMAAEQFE